MPENSCVPWRKDDGHSLVVRSVWMYRMDVMGDAQE